MKPLSCIEISEKHVTAEYRFESIEERSKFIAMLKVAYPAADVGITFSSSVVTAISAFADFQSRLAAAPASGDLNSGPRK